MSARRSDHLAYVRQMQAQAQMQSMGNGLYCGVAFNARPSFDTSTGTAGMLYGSSFTAGVIPEGGENPLTAPARPNQAWLDKRVNEMRVRL